MGIQQIPVRPLYRKDNGMYVVDVTNIPFPTEEVFLERVAISIPAGVKRAEAFISFTEGVDCFWRDDSGAIQVVSLLQRGQIFLTIVPSFVPHAVWNRSATTAFLVECATEAPGAVERTILIEP